MTDDTAASWQDALRARLTGWTVDVVATIGSTSTALLESLRDDPQAAAALVERPRLLVAQAQTAGRGRLGRPWTTPPGAALTFSIALRWPTAALPGLSLALGLAVAETLDPAGQDTPPRLLLKWPNDLLLADPAGPHGIGRKVAGLLVETIAAGDAIGEGTRERSVVIGLGLNLARPPAQAGGDWGVAGWREHAPEAQALDLLARLAPALATAAHAHARDGLAPLGPRWARRDALRGRQVENAQGEVGTVTGLAPDGALAVDVGGSTAHWASGEVRLQLRPLAAANVPSDERRIAGC